MRNLIVDNYAIDTPIIDILNRLQMCLVNGKLRDIKVGKDDITVTCPHHDGGHENKPACNIYIGEDNKLPFGYFRCFVCNEKGDFAKFVSECFDSSLDYAKEWLLKNFPYSETSPAMNLGDDICLSKPKKRALNKNVLNNPNYQSYCPYLSKRGIPRDICEMFDVKYDSQFKQIIFPCYDTKGNLIMLPTRDVDKKIFYLDKNVQKPVYGLDKIIKLNIRKFLIVEGPFDMLSCWAHKVPAVATLGKFSPFQIKEINKVSPLCVYLAQDNDIAGENMAKEMESFLSRKILTERTVVPNGFKDVNDLTEDEWKKFINKYDLPQIK